VKMRIINADGSEPEMCGNGLRCLAKTAVDHLPRSWRAAQLASRYSETPGLLRCDARPGPDGWIDSVRVDMGAPNLDRARCR